MPRAATAGGCCIIFASGFLVTLLSTVIGNGYTALQQTQVKIDLEIPVSKLLNDEGQFDEKRLRRYGWGSSIKKSFRTNFPDVTDRMAQRALGELVSANAGFELRQLVEAAQKRQLVLG